MDMVSKSDWENIKYENIVDDLKEMQCREKTRQPKKFVPIFPKWAKEYAEEFGMIEGRDFKVSQGMR